MFTDLAEVARHYNIPIYAPVGVPVGPPQVVESPPGSAQTVRYSAVGSLITMQTDGPAPPDVSGYSDFAPVSRDEAAISRRVVAVQGRPALLVHTRLPKFGPNLPQVDRFRLLWAFDGVLLDAESITAGMAKSNAAGATTESGYLTAGPGALVAFAGVVAKFTPSTVMTAGIQTIDQQSPVWTDQWTATSSRTVAASAYGGDVIAPGGASAITVVHSGPVKSYSVDLDAQGNRRLFLAAAPPPTAASEATAPGVQVAQDVTVLGTPAMYEKIATSAGNTSLLYFHVGGTQMFLEDATGGSAQDLVAVAETVGTQQDAQSPAITVGAPSLVNGKVQVPVSTTGTGLAAYSGFNVHLRWTPGVFSFASASNTGTVIASPFCPAPAPDADGGGVLYACTALGGTSTTQAGLLGTISLTPAASGCSVLHLFTYGGADAGDDSTGTYTIDPATNTPQTLPTIDGSSDVHGQIC